MGQGDRDKTAMPGGAQALTLGDGGGGVGGVRQLVRGQRRHASGWEAPWQKVVERCQLVGSRLLAPAGAAVTEPDLGDRERRMVSPQPGSWQSAEIAGTGPPAVPLHPASTFPDRKTFSHLRAAQDSLPSTFIGMVPFCPHHRPVLLSLSPFYRLTN